MRVIFRLPPLLIAGAALGGLFAPFAVSSVPTDSAAEAASCAFPIGLKVFWRCLPPTQCNWPSDLFKMKASRTPALLSWTATSCVAIEIYSSVSR
jgi:hypothetical protein